MKNLKRIENVGTGCTSQQSTQTTSVAVHCAPERSVDCSECDTVQHFFCIKFCQSVESDIRYDDIQTIPLRTPHAHQNVRITACTSSISCKCERILFWLFSWSGNIHAIHPIYILSDSIYIWLRFLLVKCPIYMKNYSFLFNFCSTWGTLSYQNCFNKLF